MGPSKVRAAWSSAMVVSRCPAQQGCFCATSSNSRSRTILHYNRAYMALMQGSTVFTVSTSSRNRGYAPAMPHRTLNRTGFWAWGVCWKHLISILPSLDHHRTFATTRAASHVHSRSPWTDGRGFSLAETGDGYYGRKGGQKCMASIAICMLSSHHRYLQALRSVRFRHLGFQSHFLVPGCTARVL